MTLPTTVRKRHRTAGETSMGIRTGRVLRWLDAKPGRRLLDIGAFVVRLEPSGERVPGHITKEFPVLLALGKITKAGAGQKVWGEDAQQYRLAPAKRKPKPKGPLWLPLVKAKAKPRGMPVMPKSTRVRLCRRHAGDGPPLRDCATCAEIEELSQVAVVKQKVWA